MPTKTAITEKLNEKLDTQLITFLQQGPSKGAPYIEGWIVIQQANQIFGFDGWASEVLEVGEKARMTINRGNRMQEVSVYTARVAVTALGVTHQDVGVGVAGESTAETEMAIKGAITDGLKRALRQFGSQFGNELYDKEQGYLYDNTPLAADAAPAPAAPPRAESSHLLQEALEGGATRGGEPETASGSAAALPEDEPGPGQATQAQMDDHWLLWPPATVADFFQWARACGGSNDYTDLDLMAVCAHFWNVACATPQDFAANVGKVRGRIAIMRWADREWDPESGEATDQLKADPMPEADAPRSAAPAASRGQ